jgi:hypothetical protein
MRIPFKSVGGITMLLTPHNTWTIYDSSKLSDYAACPRKYFYSYILGWKLDQPAHDLFFGECWHCAREYQLLNGYEDYFAAYDVFESKYRTQFDPSTDELYSPKTPEAVLIALQKFAVERANDLVENKLVYLDGQPMTEVAGTVPISENRKLHYRLDSIMFNHERAKYFSWDHKTTKEKSFSYDSWSNQFFLGIQNGTYTHCLYCLFPIDKVDGVEFCGTGFGYTSRNSSKRDAGYHASFKRVPAFKTPEQMNTWLWIVHSYIDDIERDMDRLSNATENDNVLQAFRLNPNYCTQYFGCPYHDFCQSWQNPLRNCMEPPLGFRTEYWDPSDREQLHSSVQKNLEFGGVK